MKNQQSIPNSYKTKQTGGSRVVPGRFPGGSRAAPGTPGGSHRGARWTSTISPRGSREVPGWFPGGSRFGWTESGDVNFLNLANPTDMLKMQLASLSDKIFQRATHPSLFHTKSVAKERRHAPLPRENARSKLPRAAISCEASLASQRLSALYPLASG